MNGLSSCFIVEGKVTFLGTGTTYPGRNDGTVTTRSKIELETVDGLKTIEGTVTCDNIERILEPGNRVALVAYCIPKKKFAYPDRVMVVAGRLADSTRVYEMVGLANMVANLKMRFLWQMVQALAAIPLCALFFVIPAVAPLFWLWQLVGIVSTLPSQSAVLEQLQQLKSRSMKIA